VCKEAKWPAALVAVRAQLHPELGRVYPILIHIVLQQQQQQQEQGVEHLNA
jgi:hypothetical protein